MQNGRIKQVVKLSNRRQRDARQVTIVEGLREIERALDAGIIAAEAFVCPDLLDANGRTIVNSLQNNPQTQIFSVTTAVYAKIAYREASGGILLVIPYSQTILDDLPLSDKPFLVVIDGAEKPGNLGAILRTADGAGVDGLIITDASGQGTDIHNPNVIRASLGARFTIPIAVVTPEQAIQWLQKKGIAILATTPDAELLYTAVDLSKPIAIIMGSEAHGLSKTWLDAANQHVRIPMLGNVDSLNLSTATALLLYEGVRPRNYKYQRFIGFLRLPCEIWQQSMNQ